MLQCASRVYKECEGKTGCILKLTLELSDKLQVSGTVTLGRKAVVSTTMLFQKFIVLPWHMATDTGNGTLYCDAVALTVGNGETNLFVHFFISAEQRTQNDCKDVTCLWVFSLC